MLCDTNQLKEKIVKRMSKSFCDNSLKGAADLKSKINPQLNTYTYQVYNSKQSLTSDSKILTTPPQSHLQKNVCQFKKKKRVQKLALSEKVTEDPFQSTNKFLNHSRLINFKSPKKTIKKFAISQKIVKKINFKPKKVVQQTTDQKQLIVRNIFFRESRYYYSDQVVFSEILKRIYYCSWKFDDLRNYLQPSFKVIENQTEFFQIIISEAKLFGNNIKNILIKQIKKLLTNPVGKNKVWNFKKFNKNLKQYNHTIDCLHSHYKHLESVNQQIERLIQIYFSNFLKEKVILREEQLKCHRKVFINCVYNDSLVRDFINTFYKFLDNNRHFAYYQSSFQKVEEIYENLELHSEFSSGHPSEIQSIDESTEACTQEICNHDYFQENCREFVLNQEKKHFTCTDKEEKKRQKMREKRKKRKVKKQQQKQEQKMIEIKLLDQMLAQKLEKNLENISNNFKKEKIQKVNFEFQSSTSDYFESVINSF